MIKYTQVNLINSLNISKDNDALFSLGSGSSILPGGMSSEKLAKELKKNIFLNKSVKIIFIENWGTHGKNS